MKLSNLFSLATLTAFVAADCNESGADWYDKDGAAIIADKACDLQLGGTYGPESTYNGQKGSCFNTPNGKIDFLITHITEGERLLPRDECYDGLQKEIYGCDKGGETSYTNWRYKADPNEGSC